VTTTEREILSSRVFAGLKPCATSGIENAAQSRSGAGLQPCDPLIVYEVAGGGFLRHMVRIIVGSLVEIGRGRQPVDWLGAAIASRDRAMAGPTAPPEGLFLVGVDYADALVSGS
jgi:tRNA pseudouridine(38-40) synthase